MNYSGVNFEVEPLFDNLAAFRKERNLLNVYLFDGEKIVLRAYQNGAPVDFTYWSVDNEVIIDITEITANDWFASYVDIFFDSVESGDSVRVPLQYKADRDPAKLLIPTNTGASAVWNKNDVICQKIWGISGLNADYYVMPNVILDAYRLGDTNAIQILIEMGRRSHFSQYYPFSFGYIKKGGGWDLWMHALLDIIWGSIQWPGSDALSVFIFNTDITAPIPPGDSSEDYYVREFNPYFFSNIELTPLEESKMYAVIQWTGRLGFTKQFAWEIDEVAEVADNIIETGSIMGFTQKKAKRKTTFVAKLRDLDCYSYWYYSDIIFSKNVSVRFAPIHINTEYESVKVTTKEVKMYNDNKTHTLEIKMEVERDGDY